MVGGGGLTLIVCRRFEVLCWAGWRPAFVTKELIQPSSMVQLWGVLLRTVWGPLLLWWMRSGSGSVPLRGQF
jgi:hypothetical protein